MVEPQDKEASRSARAWLTLSKDEVRSWPGSDNCQIVVSKNKYDKDQPAIYLIGVGIYFIAIGFITLMLARGGDLDFLRTLPFWIPIAFFGLRLWSSLDADQPLVPPGFLQARPTSYTVGLAFVAAGHIALLGSTAYQLLALGALASGIPFALSILLYFAGILCAELGIRRWQRNKSQ